MRLVLLHHLAEPKVGDLHLALVEQYVGGLKIVVDDRPLLLIQVLEAGEYLDHDRARLLLGQCLVGLEVEVQIGAVTVLQHRAEGVRIYLKHVVQTHHLRVHERLVNLVPEGERGQRGGRGAARGGRTREWRA